MGVRKGVSMTFKEITKFFIENTNDEELKRNLNPSWALKSLSSLNPDKREMAIRVLNQTKNIIFEIIEKSIDETINK